MSSIQAGCNGRQRGRSGEAAVGSEEAFLWRPTGCSPCSLPSFHPKTPMAGRRLGLHGDDDDDDDDDED